MEEEQGKIFTNGINAATGDYLLPPLTMGEAAGYIQHKEQAPLPMLRWWERLKRSLSALHKEFPPELDPCDPSNAGWGIVYHQEEDPEVIAALRNLLETRRKGADDPRKVRELVYRGETSVPDWLANQGVAATTYDIYKVPYYLLVVGSPARIPFSFGYQLSFAYAVGRLHFDTLQEYSAYVNSLLAYEQSPVRNARQIVYFAPCHDPATRISTSQLITPLVSGMPETDNHPRVLPVAAEKGFSSQAWLGVDARKSRLEAIFNGQEGIPTPSLLFTASHGLGCPNQTPTQRQLSGALVCQEWPGEGRMQPGYYFSSADLPDNARLQGMMVFHFACYGGGTPDHDTFAGLVPSIVPTYAEQAFLAALPTRLLSHPEGGALACMGHIDRSFAVSIDSTQTGPRYQFYRNFLYRLMDGEPIGHCAHEFSRAAGELTYQLITFDIGQAKIDMPGANSQMISKWIERNDRGAFVVLGDPAARLRVKDMPV
jgi:hypothetical protein